MKRSELHSSQVTPSKDIPAQRLSGEGLEIRSKIRSTHEVTDDFQALTDLGLIDCSVTDSDKRECVLIEETTFESCEGLEKGWFWLGR
jgi:hypothetical protein